MTAAAAVKVAIAQITGHPLAATANRARTLDVVAAAFGEGANLIVLPRDDRSRILLRLCRSGRCRRANRWTHRNGVGRSRSQ